LFVDKLHDAGGDFLFGAGESRKDLAVGGDDFDVIVDRTDGFGAIGDDKVAVFAFEFGQGAEAMVFSFQREADDPAWAFAVAEGGDDVFRFDEMQVDGMTGLGDFVVLDADWTVIAWGRGANQSVATIELAGGNNEQVFSRDDANDTSQRRVFNFDGAAHDNDLMAQREGGLGKGLAHAAGGSIGEVTYRVEVLAGGAGGDEDAGQNSLTR